MREAIANALDRAAREIEGAARDLYEVAGSSDVDPRPIEVGYPSHLEFWPTNHATELASHAAKLLRYRESLVLASRAVRRADPNVASVFGSESDE